MSSTKRDRRPIDIWGLLTWLVVAAALLLVLTGEALAPAPDHPTARERAARVAGQVRYYEALDLYGDAEGAVEAARAVYEDGRGGVFCSYLYDGEEAADRP